MATGKQSFIFYVDWYDILRILSKEQIGTLLMGVLEYQRYGTVSDFGGDINLVYFFEYFQNFFEKDKEKYENVCERNKSNGKKGGRPKKDIENPNAFEDENSKTQKNPTVSEEKTQKPKKPDNDIDIDNDIDNDIDLLSTKTKHKHGTYKNVLLTSEDLAKLKEKYPQDYEERIESLSEGIELKGYKYKNHYLAIIKWAKNDNVSPRGKPDLSDSKRYEEDFVL